MTLQHLAISTLTLGLAIILLARFLRRRVPPCCARCHFPVDQSRPDLNRCPECGSDLRMSGAVVTRGPSAKLPRRMAAACLLIALSSSALIGLRLERDGRLDFYKPSWALAFQLRWAKAARGVALEQELVRRARSGISRTVAGWILDAWRSERAGKFVPTRYDEIAEALFPTGMVRPEEIEAYSRQFLSFDIDAPDRAPAGSVLPVQTRIQLVAGTTLRFEIERARFQIDAKTLFFEPLPHVRIENGGLIGADSTAWLAHTTTNFLPLPGPVAAEQPTSLDAKYAVSVYLDRTKVGEWSHTQSRPIILVPSGKN